MRDIVHQYGKTILVITITTCLLACWFGTSEHFHLYRRLSENLVGDVPPISNAAEIASKELFAAPSMKVTPKTGLRAQKTYQIKDLMTATTGNLTPAGGKVLQVLKLYDGPSGEQQLSDVSDACIIGTGSKLSFPSRGLYLLTLSVRDSIARDALQYLYVSIEGDL